MNLDRGLAGTKLVRGVVWLCDLGLAARMFDDPRGRRCLGLGALNRCAELTGPGFGFPGDPYWDQPRFDD